MIRRYCTHHKLVERFRAYHLWYHFTYWNYVFKLLSEENTLKLANDDLKIYLKQISFYSPSKTLQRWHSNLWLNLELALLWQNSKRRWHLRECIKAHMMTWKFPKCQYDLIPLLTNSMMMKFAVWNYNLPCSVKIQREDGI